MNSPAVFHVIVQNNCMLLQILLITAVLLGLALAGLGIKLLLSPKSESSLGSCSSDIKDASGNSLSCGCGGGHCASVSEEG